jgi:hypothetical protein
MNIVPENGKNKIAQNLVSHTFNGYKVRQRSEDDYVNLTDLCKANGKNVAAFLRLPSTIKFIQGMCDRSKCDFHTSVVTYETLVTVRKGGKEGGSTYAHPEIALLCAQWASLECKLWATHTLLRVIEADTTLAEEIVNRSTDVEGLKQLKTTVEKRIQFLEGVHYKRFADGVTKMRGAGLDLFVQHIDEFSDEDLLLAGVPANQVATRSFTPASMDAIAEYLGLIDDFNPIIDSSVTVDREEISLGLVTLQELLERIDMIRSQPILAL